jgi:hypothetical protein
MYSCSLTLYLCSVLREEFESAGGAGEALAVGEGEKDSTILPNLGKKHPAVTWLELYRLQFFWTSLFTLIIVAIFAERAYCEFHSPPHSSGAF